MALFEAFLFAHPPTLPTLRHPILHKKKQKMKQLINDKLNSIAKEQNIQILYACESGSRAWGFPSPDSDYDVRFIYVYPQKEYLSINEPKDTIDLDIDENLLDFSAWELRKTLKLIRGSNVSPMEWSKSPIVYQEEEGFQKKLQALTQANFIPKAAVVHYLGLCRKTWATHLQKDSLNLKKYFYALRPLLCAKWILKHQTSPPLIFRELFVLLEEEQEVLEAIKQLLKQKESAAESANIAPVPVLQNFIKLGLGDCKAASHDLEPTVNSIEPLNDFFRSFVEE